MGRLGLRLAVPALMLSLSACDSEPGSGEPTDSMETSLQASSGGEQSGMVYDAAAGIEPPTVSIQPGKSLNFKVAFTLKDPADINMDVSPTWMHDSVNVATR